MNEEKKYTFDSKIIDPSYIIDMSYQLPYSDAHTQQLFFDVSKFMASSHTNELISNNGNTTGGELLYTDILNSVSELKLYLSEVTLEGLYFLPSKRFERLKDLTFPLFEILDKIKFQMKIPGSGTLDAEQKVQHTSDFNRLAKENLPEIWSIIFESIALEIRNKQQKEYSSISILKADLEDALKDAQDTSISIRDIYKASQQEVANLGISKHAKIFHAQAIKHEEQATLWRYATIVLLVVNAMIIYHMVSVIIKQHSLTDRAQTSILVIALITLVSFSISMCVKNFFAEKHNQATNEHRSNCLNTFELFSQSADGELKKAILLQATNTIFSYQKSGYLRKDSEQLNPNPMFELVRRIADSEQTNRVNNV